LAHIKHPVVLTTLFLSTAFVLLGAYYNFTSQDLLTRYTKEDGFIEWMQFLTFSFASIFMFFVTYERLHRGESLLKLENLGIFALGFIFLFGSLEEISWFQRIADIQASDFFLTHNKQAETNLHNLKVGDVGINKLIFGKLLFLCLLTHNLVLPIWSIKRPKIRQWIESKGFFLPPLTLVVIYVTLAIVVEILISHRREKEHLEIIGALHYMSAIFMTYGLGLGYSKPILIATDEKRRTSLIYCILLFALVYVAWILGNMSLKDFLLKP
jgi:hypothetical protein